MARLARVVVPGMPHHVVQRGNRRQEAFFGEADYHAYLSLLVEWCSRCGVRIWAYCLMPNHVHLILVPDEAKSLCRAVAQTHRRYTRRVNFREGWRGYLWQGRFASYVMDEPYLMAAARYVERNPVKAGLVACAEDWPWSSAAAHVSGRGDAVCEGGWLAERIAGWVCTWGEYLLDRDDDEMVLAMKRRENTGRPLGDNSFVQRIGDLLSRNLLPKKPGRKRKDNK